jgi:PadR family transcriptional regulator, regulatory protein PadR
MDKEILKGNIDIIILLLSVRKEVYGYEIAKYIKDSTNSFYEIGEGTLYPALRRLEEKNFLTSYWGDTDKGGRRKYYKITSEGKIELDKKLESFRLISKLINESL